jgi:hypothetical protein
MRHPIIMQMPIVGFGLWKVDNKTCADTVYNAIKTGYRLFDGALGEFRVEEGPQTRGFLLTTTVDPIQTTATRRSPAKVSVEPSTRASSSGRTSSSQAVSSST